MLLLLPLRRELPVPPPPPLLLPVALELPLAQALTRPLALRHLLALLLPVGRTVTERLQQALLLAARAGSSSRLDELGLLDERCARPAHAHAHSAGELIKHTDMMVKPRAMVGCLLSLLSLEVMHCSVLHGFSVSWSRADTVHCELCSGLHTQWLQAWH